MSSCLSRRTRPCPRHRAVRRRLCARRCRRRTRFGRHRLRQLRPAEHGLRVISHTDHARRRSSRSTSGTTSAAKDEPSGRSGFAHLFEHLMFNGSENYPGEFFTCPVQGGRRHRPERHHHHRPHQLFRERADHRARHRAGMNPTAWACSARSTRPRWTSSAAWCRTKAPGHEPAYGQLREIISHTMYPKAIPTTTPRSVR